VLTGVGSQALPVRRATESGYLEAANGEAERLKLIGWAVDRRARRPARRVLVFDRSCLLVAVRPSVSRKDLVKAVGPWASRSGFDLSALVTGARALARPSRLRVIAISGRRAWQLPALPRAFRAPP
jgi:hypothetical protein